MAHVKRLQHLQSVLETPENQQTILSPLNTNNSDDDVVIVAAVRTALTKARRGGFKDTHPTDLLAAVLSDVVKRGHIETKDVGDITVGNVLLPGAGATQHRMAMFLAGFPEEVPISAVNRQCSSGLQAVSAIAGAIKNGSIDIGIAAGVESMSNGDPNAMEDVNDKVFENALAVKCLNTMGQTSENVAEKYGLTRREQDEFAAESQKKADAAQKAGRFDAEIVAVTTKVQTPDGEKEVTINKDDGIRVSSADGLGKLKPAFKPDGSTTAGNASQVTDGAAAVLLAKRSVAKAKGLPILGSFKSFAVVGVPPEIMGVGPAYAIPEALKKAGLTINDVDVFEINEAFASQAKFSVDKLSIPMEKVNPNGGAIAIGHPLGCTGARQIATLMYELKRTNKKYGVTSMCIGTGMGAAAVFQAE